MNNYSTLIRINKDLYEQIKKVAKQQKRSINKQIEFILQNFIDSITK